VRISRFFLIHPPPCLGAGGVVFSRFLFITWEQKSRVSFFSFNSLYIFLLSIFFRKRPHISGAICRVRWSGTASGARPRHVRVRVVSRFSALQKTGKIIEMAANASVFSFQVPYRCGAAVRLLPGSCPVPARFLPGGRFLPGSCPVPARFLPSGRFSCPVPAPARFSCPVPARRPGTNPNPNPNQEPGSNRRTTLGCCTMHPCADAS
jgi:hypothetical protein